MATAVRKVLTTEAVIKTAAVEIKSLTLNGKQMTMGVFRQLENEDLIDWETGLLRGQPWGRVNYFWGDCKADHLHVVWQLQTELRRACVYGPQVPHWRRLQTQDTQEEHEKRIRDATALLLVLRHFEAGQDSHFGTWVQKFVQEEAYTFTWTAALPEHELKIAIVRGSDLVRAFRGWVHRAESYEWRKRHVQDKRPLTEEEKKTTPLWDQSFSRLETEAEYTMRIREEEHILYTTLEQHLQQTAKKVAYDFPLLAATPVRSQIHQLLAGRKQFLHREALFCEHYQESYARIAALDQLFIAV